jgi:hypothetical protein
MAWQIGNAVAGEVPLARMIAWLMSITQFGKFIISSIFFAPLQVGFALACSVTLALGGDSPRIAGRPVRSGSNPDIFPMTPDESEYLRPVPAGQMSFDRE